MAAVLSLSLSQSVTPFSLLHLFTPLALLFVRPPAFHLTLLLSRHRTALRTDGSGERDPQGFHSTTYSSQSLLRCIRCPRVDMILSLTLVTDQARHWPLVRHVRRAMTTLESAAAVE